MTISLHEEVDSTNDLALTAASSGASHGATWVADAQAQGRGRRDVGGQRRAWFSPPSANLYISVLLRPELAPDQASGLTLAAGAGICEVLHDLTGLDVWLKWPNDLYVGRRKLGGILTEASTRAGVLEAVVVGVGINVNVRAEQVPEDLEGLLTSMQIELGESVDRMRLLFAVRAAILATCDRYADDGHAAIADLVARFDRSSGIDVEVTVQGSPRSGTARGIDEKGRLRVQLDDGDEVSVSTGEARFVW